MLLRSVVNAEAEEIRIPAAAHRQRSRWSTENIPLSPESETRYRLKSGGIWNREREYIDCLTLKTITWKTSVFKYSWKCCQPVFLCQISACVSSLTLKPLPVSWERPVRGLPTVWVEQSSRLSHRLEEDKPENTLLPLQHCGRLTKWSKPCHWKPTSARS